MEFLVLQKLQPTTTKPAQKITDQHEGGVLFGFTMEWLGSIYSKSQYIVAIWSWVHLGILVNKLPDGIHPSQ